MQTIIMEVHPEEEWEDHPMLFNMVDDIKFTYYLADDWISVDDLPGIKAFLDAQ